MDDFSLLLTTIEKILSIRCGNYKEDYIKRRLLSRMNATGATGYREYHKLLQNSSEEQEKLRNALTINVTKFFRDPEVFDLVKRDLIPRILKKKNRVRIWSAGCSSGEEPYSFAIILAELGLFHKDLDGLIYATDIDQEILKKARAGVYEKSSLENLSENQVRRNFTQRTDGKFEVRPHLRERIRFQHHDLMAGVPVSRNLDIVSCRNVTIYFTEHQKNDLAREFYDGLDNEGFYIMGMSEFLGKEVGTLFTPYKPLQKVFVKNPGQK
ncbi:chemotaxis protein methyltransferase CheR [Methanolinea mesophila]|uniref:CheR family methyltransferase n=1 Tax=Methanolinea mesophila TaxID=547055 RepID=UPI001AE5E214|nr:protein-glutamate O-methyltransferase CheR [Methanolinea mesophila]MBP1927890.1 chemotaxis protein methyltransferase CheR [Methanolinea mesophila]